MTIALAVRTEGRTVLAADTLVNFSGERYPAENCRVRKIYTVGDSLIAWAGWALYAELLDAYLELQRPMSFESERSVFAFFVSFWREMRDDYTFMYRRSSAKRHPFVDLDSVFLIANRHGIFRVSGDMDVTRFEQYCAIGAGSEYALGALRVLYRPDRDAERLALDAARVAVDFNVYCGGRIDVREVP